MRNSPVRAKLHDQGARLEFDVFSDSRKTERAYFDFTLGNPELLSTSSDVAAAMLLLPAMQRKEKLTIAGEISSRLAFNLPRIRDICHTWWKADFARVEIETKERPSSENPTPPRNSGATFFSGGVDSFYTLLKHIHEPSKVSLSHLIFLRGVETQLHRIGDTSISEKWVREVAEETGMEVITGETNLRAIARLHWENYLHGHALAGIGLLFSRGIEHICIPSAFTYNHLVAHGSSPLTDEMYSTENQLILHDGSEATRAEKTHKILSWDANLVLKYLRVCINNSGEAYNCGRCRKCVRTAVPLAALGLLEKSNFLEKKWDHWAGVMAQDHPVLTQENLALAISVGADKKLIRILESVIARTRSRAGSKKDQSTIRAKATGVGRRFTTPLPEGIIIDFPHHARSRQTIPAPDMPGKTRERLVLEFLDGDVLSATEATKSIMRRAGFRASKSRVKEGGGIVVSYTKENYSGVVYSRILPIESFASRHTDAKGLIRLTFPSKNSTKIE